MSLEPTDAEIIDSAIVSRLRDHHTTIPAKVISYDNVKQVADVQIVVNAPLELADGSFVQEVYPVIPNVKVRWPRAGGFSMHWPLAADDHVLLLFCEASIAMWRETGESGDIGDLRRHCLGHAVALPGIAPDDDPIPELDAPATGIVAFNGPGIWRFGGAAADFAAHATSTNAAISALQAEITALQTEIAGVGAAQVAAALAWTKLSVSATPIIAAAECTAAAGTATAAAGFVTAGAAAVTSGSAAVAAQKVLIPSTKLKAE